MSARIAIDYELHKKRKWRKKEKEIEKHAFRDTFYV